MNRHCVKLCRCCLLSCVTFYSNKPGFKGWLNLSDISVLILFPRFAILWKEISLRFWKRLKTMFLGAKNTFHHTYWLDQLCINCPVVSMCKAKWTMGPLLRSSTVKEAYPLQHYPLSKTYSTVLPVSGCTNSVAQTAPTIFFILTGHSTPVNCLGPSYMWRFSELKPPCCKAPAWLPLTGVYGQKERVGGRKRPRKRVNIRSHRNNSENSRVVTVGLDGYTSSNTHQYMDSFKQAQKVCSTELLMKRDYLQYHTSGRCILWLFHNLPWEYWNSPKTIHDGYCTQWVMLIWHMLCNRESHHGGGSLPVMIYCIEFINDIQQIGHLIP